MDGTSAVAASAEISHFEDLVDVVASRPSTDILVLNDSGERQSSGL